ncbi:hypothetical protein P7K49_013231 [Saguinus oedipus]|uniref:Uncharacterized protein n=1 Tax=Saguinus oedipus TaxID=9490 RepID=A0ABQ9VFW5_SAGOE|nr:hypothetical protein P7K49_013231 [Saguinus oedipus]
MGDRRSEPDERLLRTPQGSRQRLTQAVRTVLPDLDTRMAMMVRYRMIDTRHMTTTATCRAGRPVSSFTLRPWPPTGQLLHSGPRTASSRKPPTSSPAVLPGCVLPGGLFRQRWVGLGLEAGPHLGIKAATVSVREPFRPRNWGFLTSWQGWEGGLLGSPLTGRQDGELPCCVPASLFLETNLLA